MAVALHGGVSVAAIILDGVKKSYALPRRRFVFFRDDTREIPETYAVDGVSMAVRFGEMRGLVGENGAGKTTLIKLIAGILSPDAGRVRVMGYDPFKKEKAFKRQVSLVLGNKNQLWWDLPAEETFLLTRALYGMGKEEYRRNLEEFATLFDAKDFIRKPVKTLSLGQRMRCEFINALLFKPRVILLDEPTLGLDIRTQAIMRSHLYRYVKEQKAVCLVTSHYVKDITDMTDTLMVLHKGKTLFDGTTDAFLALCGNNRVLEVDAQEEGARELSARFGGVQTRGKLRFLVHREELKTMVDKMCAFVALDSIHIAETDASDLVEQKLLTLQQENAGGLP